MRSRSRFEKRRKKKGFTKKKLTLAVDTLHWASPPTSRSLVSSSGGLAVRFEIGKGGVEERAVRERRASMASTKTKKKLFLLTFDLDGGTGHLARVPSRSCTRHEGGLGEERRGRERASERLRRRAWAQKGNKVLNFDGHRRGSTFRRGKKTLAHFFISFPLFFASVLPYSRALPRHHAIFYLSVRSEA